MKEECWHCSNYLKVQASAAIVGEMLAAWQRDRLLYWMFSGRFAEASATVAACRRRTNAGKKMNRGRLLYDSIDPCTVAFVFDSEYAPPLQTYSHFLKRYAAESVRLTAYFGDPSLAEYGSFVDGVYQSHGAHATMADTPADFFTYIPAPLPGEALQPEPAIALTPRDDDQGDVNDNSIMNIDEADMRDQMTVQDIDPLARPRPSIDPRNPLTESSSSSSEYSADNN